MNLIKRIFNRIEKIIKSKITYKFFIKDWMELKDIKVLSNVLSTARFTRTLTPLVLDFINSDRILVLAPHPDDEILGAGGSLLKSIEKGKKVKVIYITDGTTKRNENEKVSKTAGYDIEYLNLVNNNIQINKSTLEKLIKLIENWKPNCILIPFLADDHDDHRRVNELFMEAYINRTNKNKEFEIWAYQVYTNLPPNIMIDITDKINEKVQLLSFWETQKSRDWGHYIKGLNSFNSRFTPTNGLPLYFESFFVTPLDEYLNLCKIYFNKTELNYYLSSYNDTNDKP